MHVFPAVRFVCCVSRALLSLEGQGRQAPPGQAFVVMVLVLREEGQWRFYFLEILPIW